MNKKLKPCKICILSMELFPVAGTSVRVLNFARAIAKNKNEIHIAMFTSKECAVSKRNRKYDEMFIHTLVIDYPILWKYLHPLYTIILSIKYLQYIMRLDRVYDFNVIQSTGPNITVFGILLKKLVHKPIIADLHSCETLEEKNALKKILINLKEKYICNAASAIIVPTLELKNLYISWGIEPTKVHVVRNVIDKTKFSPKKSKNEIRKKLDISANEKIIVFHGNLKNDYNIQALDRLHEISELMHEKVKQIKFLIVGSYNNKIDDENFIYTGYVDNLPDYLNIADFAIVPIYMESLGIRSRLLEYLALSIPVVTTPIGVTGMGFVEEEGAVIVKNNIHDIAEVAVELIQDQNKLNQIKTNCEKVTNRFDLQVAARELMSVYNIIGNRYTES